MTITLNGILYEIVLEKGSDEAVLASVDTDADLITVDISKLREEGKQLCSFRGEDGRDWSERDVYDYIQDHVVDFIQETLTVAK